MTARPMTAEERLEDLLNELGWAYIEVGTGASDMQTSDDVERLTKEITDMFASLRGMREALEWQPIETAPRDGTDVLVGFARRRPTVGWHNGLGWVSSDSDHELNDPTKWLSLAALSGIEPGDEQARSPSAHSAPVSTLSKDTSK